MNNILHLQNNYVNHLMLEKNKKIIRKRKVKFNNFFIKLKVYKKTITKNEYRVIAERRKKNNFFYRKNKIRYLKRKLKCKKKYYKLKH